MSGQQVHSERVVLRTVRGDAPVASDGPLLFHEHLIADMTPWVADPDLGTPPEPPHLSFSSLHMVETCR